MTSRVTAADWKTVVCCAFYSSLGSTWRPSAALTVRRRVKTSRRDEHESKGSGGQSTGFHYLSKSTEILLQLKSKVHGQIIK